MSYGAQHETISRLADTARTREFSPGEHVYCQGEPVPLTLILEGYGAARRTTTGRRELVGRIAPAGVLFGWSGFVGRPAPIGVISRSLAAADEADQPNHPPA